MAIAKDEELVIAELALPYHVHPLITDEHVEHLVHDSAKEKGLPEVGLEVQNGVALVDFDEVELCEEVECLPAYSLLLLDLVQLHLAWDVHQLVSHTRRASLSVHAVVAVLQGVAFDLVLDRAFPWQQAVQETLRFGDKPAALVALVRCEPVTI